jgi:hypothetical protein
MPVEISTATIIATLFMLFLRHEQERENHQYDSRPHTQRCASRGANVTGCTTVADELKM